MKTATKLIDQLIDALPAALEAAKNVPDHDKDTGGTCNFDNAAIKLPRINEQLIESVAKMHGFRANRFTWFGSSCWYWLSPDIRIGQGCSQSRVAEAVCSSLNASGLEAHVYYQSD